MWPDCEVYSNIIIQLDQHLWFCGRHNQSCWYLAGIVLPDYKGSLSVHKNICLLVPLSSQSPHKRDSSAVDALRSEEPSVWWFDCLNAVDVWYWCADRRRMGSEYEVGIQSETVLKDNYWWGVYQIEELNRRWPHSSTSLCMPLQHIVSALVDRRVPRFFNMWKRHIDPFGCLHLIQEAGRLIIVTRLLYFQNHYSALVIFHKRYSLHSWRRTCDPISHPRENIAAVTELRSTGKDLLCDNYP